MTSLLVINPNTSAEVSALLLRHAQGCAPDGAQVHVATARFGARYISGEVAAAIAGHAALDVYAAHVAQHGVPDAVLLGCFGDPGLFALRALASAPVLGLAEASMRSAAARGRFVVVTGGAAWVPMLERLAPSLGLETQLAGVHAVPYSGAELAANPARAAELLRDAAREALSRWPQARTVLLGGAGLAGLAQPVGQGLELPVLDNVAEALAAAWRAAAEPATSRDAAAIAPERGPWSALTAELAAVLQTGETGAAT